MRQSEDELDGYENHGRMAEDLRRVDAAFLTYMIVGTLMFAGVILWVVRGCVT